MKNIYKFISLVLLLISLSACSPKTLEEKELANINQQTIELREERDSLQQEISSLKENMPERYIITVQIKQTHFSLDIGKHIKDSMNTIDVPFPVDKAFYDSVEEGDILDDTFRSGSLWLYGSIGSWEIKVIDKQIESE